MPERPTPPPEAPRAPLFTANEIRIAFVASAVGMIGFLVVILLLASSRPQGQFRVADDSQFEALLAETSARLDGYELLGDGRARIDIERAIELVADRGVGLSMTAIGGVPTAQAPGGDAAAAAAGAADGEVDGATVYASNCASCHQAQGQGIAGAFPPLANGHMPALIAAEGGREYLIDVLLYGLQGQIEVEGQTYNGLMPAWAQLSDGEIASVLNHELTAWGNEDSLPADFEPIAPDEVAAQRGQDLSPSDVLAQRPEPGAAPAAPADEEAAEEPDDVSAEEPAADDAEAAAADGEAADGDEATDAGDADDGAAAVETGEDAEGDADEAGDAAAAAGGADGEAVYAANCSACHQAQGQGIPGAFPPLADGHMPSLLAAEGGREYLLHVLVYGVQGQIQVLGQTYNGLMPGWAQLGDAEIAAVLNHELTAWGNQDALPDGLEAITAEEVAAVRGQDLTASDVLEMRPALE